MIEVKHIVKKYGDHLAVNNLSFCVNKGEILGFLGPNGAGKSTTMNIITGYLSATSGSVVIQGHDLFEEPQEAKKHIGYLPEIPPLYLDMNVQEYLNFVAELKRIGKKDRSNEVESAMRRTGLFEVKQRMIKHLSKGYRQRIGLAQAILGNPALIILDEPTVGLDPAQIIEIRTLIKELGKDHAVILSSHILAEISAVCDRVMIIQEGTLVASDTPDNLSKHMQHTRTIQLTVRGEKDNIHSALSQLVSEDQIEYIEEAEECTLQITSNEDRDLREDIFYALARNQCPILAMSSSKMSLEDIFLQATQETNGEIDDEERVEKGEDNESDL